jgi:hypothetical protein
MIQRLRVFGDVLVALAAVFLLGNGLFAQEIKIEMEDGIPVVYNPKESVSLPNTC